MGTRLSHLMLFVKDLDGTARFYTAVFGWSPRATADAGYLELLAGEAVTVALHALPPEIADSIQVESPPAWRGDTALKPCFATDELDGMRQKILDHGGQARDAFRWAGRRYCDCTDPEGNVLQLVE